MVRNETAAMAEASLTDLPLCQRAIADCWQFEQERDRVLAELQRALAPDNNVDKYALSSAVLSASFEHVLTICSCVGTLCTRRSSNCEKSAW